MEGDEGTGEVKGRQESEGGDPRGRVEGEGEATRLVRGVAGWYFLAEGLT